MERVIRIELTQSAWKAEVLPLNYTRIFLLQDYIIINLNKLQVKKPTTIKKMLNLLLHISIFLDNAIIEEICFG